MSKDLNNVEAWLCKIGDLQHWHIQTILAARTAPEDYRQQGSIQNLFEGALIFSRRQTEPQTGQTKLELGIPLPLTQHTS